MFAIIRTNEGGKTFISSVPTKWLINNGKQVYWPSHLNSGDQYKLLVDAQSTPDRHIWEKLPCSVRANNLKTYNEALRIEKAFATCQDTDEEQEVYQKLHQSKRFKSSGKNQLDAIFEAINTDPQQETSMTEEVLAPEKEAPLLLTNAEDNSFIINDDIPVTFTNSIETEILKNMLENFKEEMCSKFEQMLQAKITPLEVKLDEILLRINNTSNNNYTLKPIETQDLSWCPLVLPLDTIEGVNELEGQLGSTHFFRKMLIYLTEATSAKDTKDTIKVTKRILGRLFTLDNLRHFTWKGKGNKCPAFVNFGNILQLILDIEKQSDPSYSEEKSRNFLQHKWFRCLNQTIRRRNNLAAGNDNSEKEVVDEELVNDNNTEHL